MTDKELLEMAAMAVGISLEWDGPECHWVPMFYHGKTYHEWNPLENDADAFRLMVDLGMLVDVDEELKETQIVGVVDDVVIVSHGEDKHAATRRAIVLAAAEIGAQQ